MTIHKLTAGDGYTYLTRHIAGGDVARKRGQDATDYYTAEGNPPGYWLGRGIGPLGVDGTTVTEAQMRNLFGHGMHPAADHIIAAHHQVHARANMTEAQTDAVIADARRAATLGRPFPTYATLAPFNERVSRRLATIRAETGRAPSAAEEKRIRREEANRQRAAVAGYDVVFSPVKSAALLWALHPDSDVRRAVRQAHEEAMNSALAMLERHAAFTRTGTGGIAQIDTRGLVAVAFDHHDSRDGDPNLHTHVAIANKVQGVDGRWRSLDGRALYRIAVAASEHYNTAFQTALTARLGVRWTARTTAPGREPVHEIDGIPDRYLRHFSRRRTAVEGRYAELLRTYRHEHGHDPPAAVCHKLARQATLDTRNGKKPPRSLAAMRTDWTRQLLDTFGPNALQSLVAAVTGHRERVAEGDVEVLAARVVAAVGEHRSTWTVWNLHAEAERTIRADAPTPSLDRQRRLVDAVIARATALSISIDPPAMVDEPAALRRGDGTSVFVEHGAARYTSRAVLDAEQRLVDAARTPTGAGMDTGFAAAALAAFEARHGTLDPGQRDLVTAFATDPRQLVVGIGAAGTGKTTAMRAYVHVTRADGRRVIPLATSAASAAVLAADLGTAAENLHKFLHEHSSGPHADALRAGAAVTASARFFAVRPGDVILLDEAGMAGTGNLDRLLAIAHQHGATVRLLGDHQQLGAVESGGALRLVATDVGAVELDTVHRFTNPAEAAATRQLRTGDANAIDFYTAAGRVTGGSRQAMTDAAYQGWHADMTAGRRSVLVAATNADVTALSARARADRVATGHVEAAGVELHDGTLAGRGDWIVTRTNRRTLTCHGGRDFVRNGDAWQVTARHHDGALTVRHLRHSGTVRLPADYVATGVELAYATTTHRVQGDTVDTTHALVADDMSRENLYVAASRARHRTHLYVTTHTLLPLDEDARMNRVRWDPDAHAAREVLETVLGRESAELSATETIRHNQQQAGSLATLMPRLIHAAERAAADRYDTVVAEMLGTVESERLTADPAWPAVVHALHRAENTGWQPAQLLAAALRCGPLDDAKSQARLLAWRLDDLAEHRPAPAPLQRPTRADADRYAELVATLTGSRPDVDAALDVPTALRPQPSGTDRSGRFADVPQATVDRLADETAAVLGLNRQVVETHRAWPHLAGTLAAASAPLRLLHVATRAADRDLSRLARTARRLLANDGVPAVEQHVPAVLREHMTVTTILGADHADRARREPAWAALQAALRRAQQAGHDPVEILRSASAGQDFESSWSTSQILAARVSRHTTAGSGSDGTTMWRHLAWMLAAHEGAGGSAETLLGTIGPGGDISDVCTRAAMLLAPVTASSDQRAIPPWTPVALDGPWADYLNSLTDEIARRTTHLADDAARHRPPWTDVFGIPPATPADRDQWRRHLGTVAAYRDQQQITDDDPRHPLGPYVEASQVGHRAYWHAASAIVAARQLAQPTHTITPRTPAGRDQAQAIAHRVAVDTYLGLPRTGRNAVAATMVGNLGNLWHGHPDDIDTGVTQPMYGRQLTAALVRHGHLARAMEPEPKARHRGNPDPTNARRHGQQRRTTTVGRDRVVRRGPTPEVRAARDVAPLAPPPKDEPKQGPRLGR